VAQYRGCYVVRGGPVIPVRGIILEFESFEAMGAFALEGYGE
jgi:hypothetical protein